MLIDNKMIKRKENTEVEAPARKKQKKNPPQNTVNRKKSFEKKSKTAKKPGQLAEKPENWNEFKKQKKELKLKRKQNRTGYDVAAKVKKLGEKLRCKNFKGGEVERNKLINEMHSMLKGQKHYEKFVLAHDTSRVIQWLLKYSSDIVKKQISEELVPITLDMIQSKYGIFAVKRLLKYGNSASRAALINKMYGHAVKLSSHKLSAPVFEYAYSTWATPLQKCHLSQEFFGDIFKNSKDPNVKQLKDVFEQTPDLKTAILNATKGNLVRVIEKSLLDSSLVQTVLNQFLTSCSPEDRSELISLIVPHIVVIGNSRDGSKAAMQCIWHGTNKDRKLAMKTIKEHVIELCKHEHGHRTVITLLDTADDTVLLYKVILGDVLKGAKDLAVDEWGRKVLLWLVAPCDTTCFHKVFVKELEEGRTRSNCKKEPEIRRKEIAGYSVNTLLELVAGEPRFWLGKASLTYEMAAILKAGKGDPLRKAFESIVNVIVDPEWTIKTNKQDILGIEDGGIHMMLKKIAKNDSNDCDVKFGACLIENVTNEIVGSWLVLNRGCFLLVAVFENSSEHAQETLKEKLKKHKKLLKTQETAGAKILLEKISV